MILCPFLPNFKRRNGLEFANVFALNLPTWGSTSRVVADVFVALRLEAPMEQSVCLLSTTLASNGSIHYFDLSMFPITWGICFSLKANPNDSKGLGFSMLKLIAVLPLPNG
jgi:hypothetical protein